nr:helix-turn-helix transcriptional regulator [Trichormus azollae]
MDDQYLTRLVLAQANGLTFTVVRGLYHNSENCYDVDILAVVCDFFGCGMGELFNVIPKEWQ